MIKKETTETKNRVMVFCTILRPMNDTMVLLPFSGEAGGFRQLYPFVEVKSEIPCFCGFDLFVHYITLRVGFFYYNPFIQNGRPFGNIEKRIRLLTRNDLVEAMTVVYLALMIVFLPNFDDQVVCFAVIKGNEIELMSVGLA